MLLLISLPSEIFLGVEPQELATRRVSDAHAEPRYAVAQFDVDVESVDFVTTKFADERHDEALDQEGRVIAERQGKKIG